MRISIRNIVKAFEGGLGRPALNGVSLDIRSGELVALLGPSGSGKTTLLRVIAGLEVAQSGTLLFGDEDASDMSVQERKVGFVFQHYALFRHLTVADNIAFGLNVRDRATRPPPAEIRRRVDDLLELVQLASYGKRYPAQLSGGQRQRVALARALAVEPRVLLLDEPFGALDAQVRRDLRRWLRDIHHRTGHTTVFVTHDQEEALELADRVAVLSGGKVEQVGTPDEIYDTPASPFVYRFVGESGSVPVEFRDGRMWLGKYALPIPTDFESSQAGDLFLRPQDVEIVEREAPDAVAARIVGLRRSGATRRAEISIGGVSGPIETVALPQAVLSVGEEVGVRIRKGQFFPRA
ncbi:MAG: sulfate transporter, ATPase subunit [Hyphomicrobiales bacterium]|jgi:sulfate transport system ATP-binding protein|nr:sulfate transporter, ATPase subunit [Hyphomicrobiales bacterium]